MSILEKYPLEPLWAAGQCQLATQYYNSIQYGHNRKLLWTHRSNTTFPDRKSIKLTQLKYKTDVFQASIEDLQ